MMPRRAVFLDRDGTVNVEKGFVGRAEDFEFLPGAIDAMRTLQHAGFLLVVLTNQSGIARHLYSENDYLMLERWMLRQLDARGVSIDMIRHCPHHPDYTGPCGCRKPGTGMFYAAANELEISFEGSWAIGDRPRDLSICLETACRGILLGHSRKAAENGWLKAVDLREASNLILQEL